MFEFGEDLLNRIEVGAVGRQEQKARASGPDGGPDGGLFVAGEIVENDDVAGAERWTQSLLNPLGKAGAIDRLIEDKGGVDPVAAECSDESHRLPVPVRHFGMEPLADGSPASQRGHVGLGPGLIHKDKASWIRPTLELLPLFAPSGHLGPQLFGGKYAFF